MTNQVRPEPGIYYDVPAEEYFSWDCFHSSMVSATLKSARHLKHHLESDKKTKPMIIGSITDAILLDPAELEKFSVLPETYNRKDGKEMPWNMLSHSCQADYQLILDAGMTPVKQSEMDMGKAIAGGVFLNPTAAGLLEGSKRQVSLVWEDSETGVLCCARIDIQAKEDNADLKTTRDAEKGAFARQATNLGYHVQAAFYTDGWAHLAKCEPLPWHWIAAENTPPHCCAVYTLDNEGIEAGRLRYRTALHRYKDYRESDPDFKRGFSDFAEEITISHWGINEAFNNAEDANVGI